jgi:Secreted repeat of unknown function
VRKRVAAIPWHPGTWHPQIWHWGIRRPIGTATRGDGGTQVTYGGHPLYYYVGDKAPGDVAGQDLDQFGAKWYVLDKAGQKIDND